MLNRSRHKIKTSTVTGLGGELLVVIYVCDPAPEVREGRDLDKKKKLPREVEWTKHVPRSFHR